ncbi:hypothetical protein CFPU101_40220 [Chroococcus sp. FPU101]|nr:hypothetical protein CFPU101_40220 [Chroococcus sp. FPU101]
MLLKPLLLIGINLVTGEIKGSSQNVIEQDNQTVWQEAESVYRKIVIPLAMPLLVRPSVIANVILYANEVESKNSGF